MSNITIDRVLQRMSEIKEEYVIIGNDYDTLDICLKCPVLSSNLNEQELAILIDILKDNRSDLSENYQKSNLKEMHPLLWAIRINQLCGVEIEFTKYRNEFKRKLYEKHGFYKFDKFLHSLSHERKNN